MRNSLLILAALLVFIMVFLFQQFNYAEVISALFPVFFTVENPNVIFMVNKTIRLILNDLACMLLIVAWFKKRNHLMLAFYLFLLELFVLLPVYFYIKLSLEGHSEISSPLLSHIHRLIVNPLLMILLMAGFLYQRIRTKNT